MLMTEREYWFWLNNIEGIGSVAAQYLLEQLGSPEDIWKSGANAINRLPELSDRQKAALTAGRNSEQVKRQFDRMTEKGIYFVTCREKDYPIRLRQLYDYPIALYYKGRLPDPQRPALAIVGARTCSPYGREVALEFAGELAEAGVDIISGLARGVDGHAHEGALRAGGNTYGILGCGPDICYPRTNLELFMQMQQKGGVISEFAPGTAPTASHFPMRNRIISGLADGLLLVEARERSGSLITADQALEQGRDVFVIPGRINDPLSEGCNRLIQMGAILVRNPGDILQQLVNWQQLSFDFSGSDRTNIPVKDQTEFEKTETDETVQGKMSDRRKINLVLDSSEEMVYACLDLVPKSTQYIVSETGLMPQEVMSILERLERKGCIRESSRSYYVRAGLWR